MGAFPVALRFGEGPFFFTRRLVAVYLVAPVRKKKPQSSLAASRREEGPFVPRDVRGSTGAKRDFNDIKADADIFRLRILCKP